MSRITRAGTDPGWCDTSAYHRDAYFFATEGREGKLVAVVPVAFGPDGSVAAVEIHHHPDEVMITVFRLESPTMAPCVERCVHIHFLDFDAAGTPLSGAVVNQDRRSSNQRKTDQDGEVVIGIVACTPPHESRVVLAGNRLVTPIGKVATRDISKSLGHHLDAITTTPEP